MRTETGSQPDGLDLVEATDQDRFVAVDDADERTHFAAFLMGGLVVASGLLAFLYYDTDNLSAHNRDLVTTTGSIARPAGSIMDQRLPSLPSVRTEAER